MNESKRIVFLDYVRVFACFLGYLVMAHYIREHLDWSTRKKMIVGAVLMTVGAIVTILSFYVQATPGIVISTPVLEIGWNFCTINVACLTAGTFLMFSCIKRSEAPRIITGLSGVPCIFEIVSTPPGVSTISRLNTSNILQKLTLTLFVFWIFADNANASFSFNYFAFFANWFY